MRSSVYIEGPGGETVLIDAGPEFRLQAVRAGIDRLDAIFLTHAHADHINGLDDVRPLSRLNPLPVYGNQQTIEEMKERFSYIWKETQLGGGKPQLNPHVVSVSPVQIGSLIFTPLPVKHGVLDILGWEVGGKAGGSFLYLTDTSAIPAATMERLISSNSRSRVIVIGGLRARPHETHFTFEQAIDVALGIGAKEIFLTHICHEHSHVKIEEICQKLRKEGTEIHPAWDGLELFL